MLGVGESRSIGSQASEGMGMKADLRTSPKVREDNLVFEQMGNVFSYVDLYSSKPGFK